MSFLARVFGEQRVPDSMRNLPGRRHICKDDRDDVQATRSQRQYAKNIEASRQRKRDDYRRRSALIAEQRRQKRIRGRTPA